MVYFWKAVHIPLDDVLLEDDNVVRSKSLSACQPLTVLKAIPHGATVARAVLRLDVVQQLHLSDGVPIDRETRYYPCAEIHGDGLHEGEFGKGNTHQ